MSSQKYENFIAKIRFHFFQIRTQDLSTMFASVAGNPAGYEVAREYLYQNIDKIYDLYGPKNQQIVRYLSQISSQIITEDELREVGFYLFSIVIILCN